MRDPDSRKWQSRATRKEQKRHTDHQHLGGRFHCMNPQGPVVEASKRQLMLPDCHSVVHFTRLPPLGLGDDDLAALEVLVMLNPRGGPLVRGTGGLRKLRFAPSNWRVGKRGAARVGYVYFHEYGVVLLVIVYPKGEKDDLSMEEKAKIKKLIATIRREFEQGTIK